MGREGEGGMDGWEWEKVKIFPCVVDECTLLTMEMTD